MAVDPQADPFADEEQSAADMAAPVRTPPAPQPNPDDLIRQVGEVAKEVEAVRVASAANTIPADLVIAKQPAPDQPSPAVPQQEMQEPAPGEPAPNRMAKGDMTPDSNLFVGTEPLPGPAETQQQQQPQQQDPLGAYRQLATEPAHKSFLSFLEVSPLAKQGWLQGDTKARREILDSWAKTEARKRVLELLNAGLGKGMTPKRRDETIRLALRMEEERIRAQLVPFIGINSAKSLSAASLYDPDGTLNRLVRQAGVAIRPDEITTWVQAALPKTTREYWLTYSPQERRAYLKSLGKSFVNEQLTKLASHPTFRSMPPKQRDEALKTLRQYMKDQFDAVAGPASQDNEFPNRHPMQFIDEKVQGDSPRPSGTIRWWLGLAGTALGSVVEGAGDLVASSGDILAYATGDESWRKMALVKIANDVAEFGQRMQDMSMPEDVKRELQIMQQAFDEGRVADALAAVSPSTYAYIASQMSGYVLGSGGVVGGTRALAARYLAAKSSGWALRIGSALKGKRATAAGVAIGAGAAQGHQEGERAAADILNADPRILKGSPTWHTMVDKLTATLGRAPTDKEVQQAMADFAAARTTVYGGAAAAASIYFIGGITERMFTTLPKQLGGEIARAAMGTVTRKGGRVAGAAGGALREGVSEAVENVGLVGARHYQERQAGLQPDAAEIGGQAAQGFVLGAMFGGAISAIAPQQQQQPQQGAAPGGQTPPGSGPTPPPASEEVLARAVEDDVKQDPDIQAAVAESKVAGLEMVRVAAQNAGVEIPAPLKEAMDAVKTGDDVSYGLTILDEGMQLTTIAGRKLVRKGDELYLDEAKLDTGNPAVRALLTEVERQNEATPHSIIAKLRKSGFAEADVLKVPQDIVEEETINADVQREEQAEAQILGRQEQRQDAEQPAPLRPQQEPQTPEDALSQADAIRAYVNMLVQSGEPLELAIESARKTFGKRAIPKDIRETYQQVDPQKLAEEQRSLLAPAPPERIAAIKNRLPTEGRIYVVRSAADMPGLGAEVPIATFKVEGGKDEFIVVNAAAIKDPRKTKQLYNKHLFLKQALEHRGVDFLLRAADLAAMEGTTYKVPAKTKSGFRVYGGGKPLPKNVKSTKSPTGRAIIEQFQERLMRGDLEALSAVRQELDKDLRANNQVTTDYLLTAHLWRIMVEAGLIPKTDAARVAALPPGTPMPSGEVPATDNTETGEASREETQAALAPEKARHEARLALKKSHDNTAPPPPPEPPANEEAPAPEEPSEAGPPPQIVISRLVRRTLQNADDAVKLDFIRGFIMRDGVDKDVRDTGLKFINAMRSMTSVATEYRNLQADIQWRLDLVLEQKAKELGITVDELRTKYNQHRLALHAIERNTTLWATRVRLQNKEARAERQALHEAVMSGAADPEATMARLIEVAKNGNPEESLDTAVYAGMTNAEAQSIIDAIRGQGLEEHMQPMLELHNSLSDMILRWREEAGVYAGPAQNIVRMYGWKHYVPLFDTKQAKVDYDAREREDAIRRVFNPANLTRDTAKGRKTLNIDVWANFEKEARDAAYSAAMHRAVQAFRDFVKVSKEKGLDVQFGTIHELGKVEYYTGDETTRAGWKLPEGMSVRSPNKFNVYNPETGKWEALVVFDKEMAAMMRNQLGEELVWDPATRQKDLLRAFATNYNQTKLAGNIGDWTRLHARGLTTFNPSYWLTTFWRDFIQTPILVATQRGISPFKVQKEILARMAQVQSSGYANNLFKFMRADAAERERLANDPEFLKQPGMDRLVERWRAGGLITFQAQVGEDAGRLSLETGPIGRRLRQYIRQKLGREGLRWADQRLENVEALLAVIDNMHRQVVYDILRETGATPHEAALYARDIMDFNKRSEVGKALNSIWAFTQSGLTGVATIFTNHIWKKGAPPVVFVKEGNDYRAKYDLRPQTLLRELNWKAAAWFVAMGAANVIGTAALLGTDDDGVPVAAKITPSTWMMYDILPLGSDTPIKLPKQYGLHQLFDGLGAALALKALGLANPRDIAFAYSEMFLTNFVPVGQFAAPEGAVTAGRSTPGDWVAQLAANYAPTALGGVAELMVGREKLGGRLGKHTDEAAGYVQGYIGTPVLWRKAAQAIYEGTPEWMKIDLTPEQVEVFVRDSVPILGPVIAHLPRLFVGMTSRPERSPIEEIINSQLTPLPRIAYDRRYYPQRLESYVRANYIRPADEAYNTVIRQASNEATKRQLLKQFYERYPYYRAVRSLWRNYSTELNALRAQVVEYRSKGDYERATESWRKYNELKTKRLHDTLRILGQFGIEVDY